jgi:hypothetical protein
LFWRIFALGESCEIKEFAPRERKREIEGGREGIMTPSLSSARSLRL